MTALSCQRAVWQPCRKCRISYKRSNSQLQRIHSRKREFRGEHCTQKWEGLSHARDQAGLCCPEDAHGCPAGELGNGLSQEVLGPPLLELIQSLSSGRGQQGLDRSKQAKHTLGELTACPSQMGQLLLSSWGTPDIVRPSKILEDAGNPGFCVKTLDFQIWARDCKTYIHTEQAQQDTSTSEASSVNLCL